MMLQRETPEDFVIASGVQHSVRQFTTWAAAEVGITLRSGALFLDGQQTFAALSGSGGTVDLCVCAALTINQAIDTLYAGAIVGAASVTKAGAGTLTLRLQIFHA